MYDIIFSQKICLFKIITTKRTLTTTIFTTAVINTRKSTLTRIVSTATARYAQDSNSN